MNSFFVGLFECFYVSGANIAVMIKTTLKFICAPSWNFLIVSNC